VTVNALTFCYPALRARPQSVKEEYRSQRLFVRYYKQMTTLPNIAMLALT
jgi:hypothetical protein